MKLDKFKDFINKSIDMYCKNMNKLESNDLTKTEWMESFLAWVEWKTGVPFVGWDE